MAETKYTGYQYRLRAGSPMSMGEQGAGNFYVHTFMAEQNKIDVYTYIDYLPSSTEFRGQVAGLEDRDNSYISAQFSRLQDKSGTVFSGKVVYNPTYIEEDSLETSPMNT